jgi:hypothetical protein
MKVFMQQKLRLLLRITSFVWLLGLFVHPVLAESLGHWSFTGDGTNIELHPCTGRAAALCGVLTRLPKSAAVLSEEERKALCGIAMLSDLQSAKVKDGERARLDGFVIDIESMTRDGKASRFAASFVVLSDTRARLDVKATFGFVVESHQLIRALTAVSGCK